MAKKNSELFWKRVKSGYIDSLVNVFTVSALAFFLILVGYITSVDQIFYIILIVALLIPVFQKDISRYPSLGKQMFGICVVTNKNGKPKVYQIAIRNFFLYFTLGIDMAYLVSCSDKRRRLGDLIAGTKVVEISELTPKNEKVG